jgi:integrase
MRRKRFQKGSVKARKHGRHKVWVAQWWQEGGRRSKVLGRCTQITKAQAEILMSSIVSPVNNGTGPQTSQVALFGAYIKDVYLPLCRRKWKESTRMTTEPVINNDIRPVFENRLMSSITREELQQFLDAKAQMQSRSVVEHLRWHLSGIFKTALSDGVVNANPAGALFVPDCIKAESDKRTMTVDEIRLALSVLDLRERVIFKLAVFLGLRPGEILALRVGKISENSLLIDQRAYKGNLDTPKGRKGKVTKRTIALTSGIAQDLETIISLLPSRSPDQFVFQSERGTHLWRDNVWRRQMQPRLATVGLEWASFQVLRRTNASLSRKLKIDDKVSADQRGHGLGVSMEVYSRSDLEEMLEAVTKLESEVIR